MSFFVESKSGAFYCNPANHQYIVGSDRRYAVYSEEMRGNPVAWIKQDNGAVIGVQGNSGNRFDGLSGIEKVDIATLVHSMIGAGHVDRLPTAQEQEDAASLCC